MRVRKAHYKSFNTRVLGEMISFKFVRFTFVVYVSHSVLVTDIILNITSQEHLTFTLLHIGSRLFELFSKEVRVKKQPGMPLKLTGAYSFAAIIKMISLPMHILPRVNVMLDFIWTLQVQLRGTWNKWTLQNNLVHSSIRTNHHTARKSA